MSSEDSPHLSTYMLDVLRLGGLSAEEAQRAQAHLAQCQECSQRMAKAHTSAEHFQKTIKPLTRDSLRERMQARKRPAPRARPGLRWALLGAGGLVAALLGWLIFGRG